MVANDWLEPVSCDQSPASPVTSARSSAAPSDGCRPAGAVVTSPVTSQNATAAAAAAAVAGGGGGEAARGASNDVGDGDVDDASVDDARAPTTDVCAPGGEPAAAPPPESAIIAVCGNGADAVTMPDSTHDGWPVESGSKSSSGSSGSSGSTGSMRKLKSALKTTTGKSERFRNSGIKSRSVRFNEALNTFLECDYVIYVDDDEYDLLYDLSSGAVTAPCAPCAPCAPGAPCAPCAPAASVDPATLVSIRSFDLQLPETCVNYPPVGATAAAAAAAGMVSGAHPPSGIQCLAVMNSAGSGNAASCAPPATTAGDQLTLSPPDGYKDALYAAVMETIVDDSGGFFRCILATPTSSLPFSFSLWISFSYQFMKCYFVAIWQRRQIIFSSFLPPPPSSSS